MADIALRDRDAIITSNNIIFRVYGYSHPPGFYVCDPEYAAASIFNSKNPKAPRGKRKARYYKFYADEGLHFIQKHHPEYTVFFEPLQETIVGIPQRYIAETRQPSIGLRKLLRTDPSDNLLNALQQIMTLITSSSRLTEQEFGVFGSLLHNFYHPKFSDIDLIIYGKGPLRILRQKLEDLQQGNLLRNEFETKRAVAGKRWRFVNYSIDEYIWHQQRKSIYALFIDRQIPRTIKIEFEPVKTWDEVYNEYDPITRVTQKGWIKASLVIKDSSDAPFMPAIYQVDDIRILEGFNVDDIERILSYVEEFRMQVEMDEQAIIEGNLEQVETRDRSFHQITLSYGPRYYEQVLKVLKQ